MGHRSALVWIRRLLSLVARRYWLTAHEPLPLWSPSVFIRHLDAGSCNDCELEIAALENPRYDLERFGLHLVASPCHADLLLLSGPFVRSMVQPALAALRAMPEPHRVMALGDAFGEADVFRGSYALVPIPDELKAGLVNIHCGADEAGQPRVLTYLPGDPPTPQQILVALQGIGQA